MNLIGRTQRRIDLFMALSPILAVFIGKVFL